MNVPIVPSIDMCTDIRMIYPLVNRWTYPLMYIHGYSQWLHNGCMHWCMHTFMNAFIDRSMDMCAGMCIDIQEYIHWCMHWYIDGVLHWYINDIPLTYQCTHPLISTQIYECIDRHILYISMGMAIDYWMDVCSNMYIYSGMCPIDHSLVMCTESEWYTQWHIDEHIP